MEGRASEVPLRKEWRETLVPKGRSTLSLDRLGLGAAAGQRKPVVRLTIEVELLVDLFDITVSQPSIGRFTHGSMTVGTVLCLRRARTCLRLLGPGPPVSESDVSYVPRRLS
jgi:hypothetical protein